MPKTIKDYGVVICRDIKRSEGMDYESSDWRMEFVGRQGTLELRESLYKNPGGQFLYFEGANWSEERQDFDDWWLRTWYGTGVFESNVLTFSTRNSVYTFELMEDE